MNQQNREREGGREAMLSEQSLYVYPCFHAEELWTFSSLSASAGEGRDSLEIDDSPGSCSEGGKSPSRCCTYTPGVGRSHRSRSHEKVETQSASQSQEDLNVECKTSNEQRDKDSADDVDSSVPYEDHDDIGKKTGNRRGKESGKSLPHSTPNSEHKEEKIQGGKRNSPYDAVADSSDDEELDQGEEIPEIRLQCGASGEPYTTVILLPLCMRCQPFFPLECATTLLFRMALELLRGNKTAERTRKTRRGNCGRPHEGREGAVYSGGEDDEGERGLRGETDGTESEGDMRKKSMRRLSRHGKAEDTPEMSEREAVLICSQTQLIDHPPYEPAISSHISIARPRRPHEISTRRLQVRRLSPVSSTLEHPFPVSPAPQNSPLSSASSSSPPTGPSPFSALPHDKEKRDPKRVFSLSLPKEGRRSLSTCSPSPSSSSSSRGRALTRRESLLKESPRQIEKRQDEPRNGETKSVTVRRKPMHTSKRRTHGCLTSVHSRRRRPPGKDLKSRRRSPLSLRHRQLGSSDLRRLDRLKIKYVPLFRSADSSPSTGSSGSSNSKSSNGGLSPLLTLICTIPLLTSTSPPSCFFFLSPSCALAPPPPSSSSTHHASQRWYRMESFFETPLPAISCRALSPSRSVSGAWCSLPLLASPFALSLFYSRLCSVSPSTWAFFLSLLVTATTYRFTPPSPALFSTSMYTSSNGSSVTSSGSGIRSSASQDSLLGEDCPRPSISFPPLVFIFEFFPTACCVACCPFSAFFPSSEETMKSKKEQQSSGEFQHCDEKRQADGGGEQDVSDCGKPGGKRGRSLETSPRERASIEEDDSDDHGVGHDRRRHGEGPCWVKEKEKQKDQTNEKEGSKERSYPHGEEPGNHHEIQRACVNERRRRKDEWIDNNEQDPQHMLDSPPAAAATHETNLREDSCVPIEGNREETQTSVEVSPVHGRRQDIGPLPPLEPKSPWVTWETGDMDGAQRKDWRSVSSSPSPKRKRGKKDWRPAVCREGESTAYSEKASSSCSCSGEVRLCGIESSKLIRLCRERCCRVVMLLPSLSSSRSFSKEVSFPKQQQGRDVAGEQEGEREHAARSHHHNGSIPCSSPSCGCGFNTLRRTGVGETRRGREQLREEEMMGQQEQEEDGVREVTSEDESPWIEWLRGRGGYVADLSFPGLRSS